jgi:hypothetical protein
MQVALRASENDINKALQVVPPTAAARLTAMRWLADHGQAEAADQLWLKLSASGQAFRPADAFFYFDSLLQRHKVAEASSVWRLWLRQDSALRSRVHPDQVVVNGDFESDLLNGGFAWRYLPTSGVTVTFDTTTFQEGTRSLSLQVDGDGLEDAGVYEYVRVEPGARYVLSGWMHAEELLGAHGWRLGVADAYSNKFLLVTDDGLGSFAWREFTGELTIPLETELVKLSLVRVPRNGPVRGRLWVDALRLEKR